MEISSRKTPYYLRDAAAEDVDAIFVDANGDQFPDLYVVSGGNEAMGKDSSLLDRFYINDGKGNFTKSQGLLPSIFENKSCVAAADIDHDGDQDLFIGTLANPVAYGVPQNSHLLVNDGHGHFDTSGLNVINLSKISGSLPQLHFADLNKDGWDGSRRYRGVDADCDIYQ